MFLCVNRLTHFNGDLWKKKYCKERIQAKVGVCMCILKIKINTIYYFRLMGNFRYNTQC